MQNYNHTLSGLLFINDKNTGESQSSLTSFVDTFFHSSYRGVKPVKSKLKANPHDFVLTRTQRQGQKGTFFTTDTTTGYFREAHGVFVSTNSSHVGNFRTEAGTIDSLRVSSMLDAKLLEKWRGNIDLSIDALQGRQTLALGKKLYDLQKHVRSFNVNGLWKSYKDFRRLGADTVRRIREKSIREQLSGVGGLWLEYSYGLKPTAQTVYDTIIELNREFQSQQCVEVKAGLRLVKKDRRPGSFFGYPANFGVEETLMNDSVRGHAQVYFDSSASAIQLLGRFSSMNPASILWENMPFSFCVDWVYDIGGYLRNQESAMMSRQIRIAGYKTISSRLSSDTSITMSKSGPTGSTIGQVNGWDRILKIERSRITNFPATRPPRFEVDFSNPIRAANAIALNLSFLKDKR